MWLLTAFWSTAQPENARIAFERLDRDGDGSISRDELNEAWMEYYTSEDPHVPGDWLFGDIWSHVRELAHT